MQTTEKENKPHLSYKKTTSTPYPPSCLPETWSHTSPAARDVAHASSAERCKPCGPTTRSFASDVAPRGFIRIALIGKGGESLWLCFEMSSCSRLMMGGMGCEVTAVGSDDDGLLLGVLTTGEGVLWLQFGIDCL